MFRLNTNFDSYQARSKFNTAWGVYIVCFILFSLLSIVDVFLFGKVFFPSTIMILISVVFLVILYVYKSYKVVGYLTAIFGSAVIQLGVFFELTPDVISLFSYILFLGLFVHHVLKPKYGFLVILFNLMGLSLYIFTDQGKSNVVSYFSNPNGPLDFVIDTSVAFAGCIYILYKIRLENLYIERLYHESIKELMLKNDEIYAKNEEKKVLIQEIHHRVKNNLQLVTSLLRLQQSQSEHPIVEKQLQNAINRVNTIASVHERIYAQTNFKEVELVQYFQELLQKMVASGEQDKAIKVEVSGPDVVVSVKILVPLASIVNELATNSMKYAFSEVDVPLISLEVSESRGNLNVVYKDNGSWKDEGVNEGIGRGLIEAFTDQLDGDFTLSKEDTGTTYRFDFKLNQEF